MSSKNQQLVAIPQEVIDEVTEKLLDCKAKLHPYMQALSGKQRMAMFKMGDKSVPLVNKTKSYMVSNPEFIPHYFDQNDFYRDELIARQLRPLANLSNQLSADINDTATLAGSNTMHKVSLYYGQVLEAFKKGVANSRSIYEDLSERFAKQKSSPPFSSKNE